MRTYNISDKTKYYRQNNNEIKPGIRCKPTATVQALDLAGWKITNKKSKRTQPEDILTEFMETTYGPDAPEDWTLIAKAINEHFLPGSFAVIGPRFNWMIREALFGIIQKTPFVTSTWLTSGGHVVNIVGFVTEQDEEIDSWDKIVVQKITEIIIDDPYGDRTSGKYDTKKSGFNNHYPRQYFMTDLWRGIGIQIRLKEATDGHD